MEISLPNYLPEGLLPEVFGGHGHEPLRAMLREEGLLGKWTAPFYERAKTEAKTDPGPWTIWEGFYHKLKEGGTNLIILGVGFDHGTFYSRAIRVRRVADQQLAAAQEALPRMIRPYLDQLFGRSLPPGQGKTNPWFKGGLWSNN